MKRSLFKQLMVSAFFTCSLSADVPDVGHGAGTTDGGRQMTDGGRRMTTSGGRTTDGDKRRAERLVANQTMACAFELYDGSGIRPLSSAVCRPSWAMPDPVASALPVVWPLNGSGIHPMDRACVCWDALKRVSLEAMNMPTDPLDTAFLVPRFRMPAALQERAWQVLEPACSLDVAGLSGRADMAAMIPRLKKVFIKEGVPQQWVWMAEVESALNPQAKSSAGATGLFQLMPGTARRFGLRTAPVDDRMEPEKSAGAAAQYLKFLRKEFGCWSLALAAYNAGEGRVKEIMKTRNARTFNEVERYLPSETRAYVPKVMALVALREDQLHGLPGAYWMP